MRSLVQTARSRLTHVAANAGSGIGFHRRNVEPFRRFFAAMHLVSQRDLDRSALYNSFGCEVIRPVSQWRCEERQVTLQSKHENTNDYSNEEHY
jgi:hypothetical protein